MVDRLPRRWELSLGSWWPGDQQCLFQLSCPPGSRTSLGSVSPSSFPLTMLCSPEGKILRQRKSCQLRPVRSWLLEPHSRYHTKETLPRGKKRLLCTKDLLFSGYRAVLAGHLTSTRSFKYHNRLGQRYRPHVTREGTHAQRLNNFPEVTQLVRGR